MLVNLFGAPCAGKTTGAHGIMYNLKKAGVKCFYVPEYATELVLNDDKNTLSCQDIIYGEQLKRIRLAVKNYEVVVTDGPLLLTSFYDRKYQRTYEHTPLFEDLVKQVHHDFNNFNVFFDRIYPYDMNGRYQTDEESMAIQTEIKQHLWRNVVKYETTTCTDENVLRLTTNIIEELSNV